MRDKIKVILDHEKKWLKPLKKKLNEGKIEEVLAELLDIVNFLHLENILKN